MFYRREELHLCQHDSMVWVWSVIDVVMHLCVELLYMWVREGRGAKSVSFSNESFGDFSEARYHVRGVTLGDVVFCGGT